SYRKEGDYVVTLIARSETGCLDSVKRELVVSPDYIYFPNAFTPNGDLNNDWYYYVFPYSLAEVEFSIYDRWGELIFRATDQQHNWDGTYRGKPLPDGV